MLYTFKVEDMTCGGCAASVRASVAQVPGVQSIQTDPRSRQVVVESDAAVTAEVIAAAITKAGYSPRAAEGNRDEQAASR
jgi:copper chaperone